jgi:DNA-directed RNA polymerase subunit RPC12/RpoP
MAKKVVAKNGKKETYFNKYVIGDSNVCPECHRTFKDYDLKNIEERGTISCVKCGSKLSRK